MDLQNAPGITPDQLSAIAAGQGFAHLVDPETQQVYLVIEQARDAVIDLPEEDLRQALDEAADQIKRGEVSTHGIGAIAAQARREFESAS